MALPSMKKIKKIFSILLDIKLGALNAKFERQLGMNPPQLILHQFVRSLCTDLHQQPVCAFIRVYCRYSSQVPNVSYCQDTGGGTFPPKHHKPL